jgi:hypothetical protein
MSAAEETCPNIIIFRLENETPIIEMEPSVSVA